jgi:hypothetical protein
VQFRFTPPAAVIAGFIGLLMTDTIGAFSRFAATLFFPHFAHVSSPVTISAHFVSCKAVAAQIASWRLCVCVRLCVGYSILQVELVESLRSIEANLYV